MAKILLITLFGSFVFLASCGVFGGEDEIDESEIPSVNNPNSVFKATINGEEWKSEFNLIQRGFRNLDISGGQTTDTIMFFLWEKGIPEVGMIEADSTDENQLEQFNIILTLQKSASSGTNSWKEGFINVTTLTEDSIKAEFEYITVFSDTVTNGKMELYIGDQ